ncbi:MAG TPA: hypothetical protein VKF82_11090 [Candidatus Eremiobacteraceae bacterium]|nr:hypothetical protein [Candidatus Eremiobacteraceae bacterium]
MHRTLVALGLLAAVCAPGCGVHSRGASGATSAPTPASQAHIEIHGVITIAHDAAVRQCYIGKPGPKLLNGYSVTFAADQLIDGGEVLIPDFHGDGTYTGAAGVILNVAQGPGFPHGTTLEERPDTKVTVTIGDGGKSGRALLTDYRSLYGRNGDERGGAVSGSITWTCAQVARGPAMQG